MKNASDVAKKWSSNLSNAGDSIKQGVEAVTVNPAAKAIAALPTAKANYAKAIDSGKTAAGLRKVSLGDWQQAMLSKGMTRISEGASQATSKVEAVMSQLLPYVQSAVNSLPPRGTDQQNEERMVQFVRKMRQFKKGS